MTQYEYDAGYFETLLAKGRQVVKADIDQSACRLVTFLDNNRKAEIFKFPFSYSFPMNSCQGTSLLFKFLLEEKYGIDRAVIVKGTKRNRYESHYWVELDGNIYDLTAHQFRGVREPIIGETYSPLKRRFPTQVADREYDFLDRETVNAFHRGNVFDFGL